MSTILNTSRARYSLTSLANYACPSRVLLPTRMIVNIPSETGSSLPTTILFLASGVTRSTLLYTAHGVALELLNTFEKRSFT